MYRDDHGSFVGFVRLGLGHLELTGKGTAQKGELKLGGICVSLPVPFSRL